jgi:hypothetical protein
MSHTLTTVIMTNGEVEQFWSHHHFTGKLENAIEKGLVRHFSARFHPEVPSKTVRRDFEQFVNYLQKEPLRLPTRDSIFEVKLTRTDYSRYFRVPFYSVIPARTACQQARFQKFIHPPREVEEKELSEESLKRVEPYIEMKLMMAEEVLGM